MLQDSVMSSLHYCRHSSPRLSDSLAVKHLKQTNKKILDTRTVQMKLLFKEWLKCALVWSAMHAKLFCWRTDLSQTFFPFRPVVSNDTASPFRFIKEVPSAPWCVSPQVTWQCCVNNHFHLLQMLLIRSGNKKLACFLITSWSSFKREWKKWSVSQFVIDSCTIRWCNA